MTNPRSLLIGCCALLVVGMTACKREVPDHIIRSSMEKALKMAPRTSSGMCGVSAMGLSNPRITIKEKREGHTGVVHVTGAPRGAIGGPAMCEGDVEYAYSYTTKTKRRGKTRTTTTTWNLQRITLVAVQTPGVVAKGPAEEAAPPDDDEGGPAE